MTTKRYRAKLTVEAREELKTLTTQGRVSARKQTHARILLPCDEGREDGGGHWTLAYRPVARVAPCRLHISTA